jgi:hypothetical protein
MKLVFDVVNGHVKCRSREEPDSNSAPPAPLQHRPPTIPGYRKDGTDRGEMIVAFSRHFPGMSAQALGKLFDKYRTTGRIDVQWNAETGQYEIRLRAKLPLTRGRVVGDCGVV